MSYYFMLGACPLPINPSALNIKTPSLNKTVTLINDGEINIPKDHGLREISFDFLLPTFQKYPFASYQLGNYTAATIILYLKLWKSMKIPLPFIVVRMSPKGKFLYFTSIKSVIEDFTFDEDANEHGFDTMCSITLKEYVDYGTKRVKIKQTQNGTQEASTTNTRSTADRQTQRTTTVRDGETPAQAHERAGGYSSKIEHDYDRLMNGDYDTTSTSTSTTGDTPTSSGSDWRSTFRSPSHYDPGSVTPNGVNITDTYTDYSGQSYGVINSDAYDVGTTLYGDGSAPTIGTTGRTEYLYRFTDPGTGNVYGQTSAGTTELINWRH